MSNTPNLERDESPNLPLARAVVPMLAAAGAVTLALTVMRGEPFAQQPTAPAAANAPAAEGTPYSDMHRRVEEAPGDPQPLPPTF